MPSASEAATTAPPARSEILPCLARAAHCRRPWRLPGDFDNQQIRAMKGRGPAILSGASKAERKAALEQAMHVLINGGSASASEIVAGALSGKEF
jgi:hypothetical protein